MPCPASPATDGFHRYQLARQGAQTPGSYATACVYCGQEKQVRPPAPPNLWATAQHHGGLAARAARRTKREA